MEFYVIVCMFGLVVGSFLNVLIDRMPRGQSVIWKPSHCDYCKKQLRWFELIPVLSYVLQGGSCRRCHKRLSFQYPIVELLTALGFLSVFLYVGDLTTHFFLMLVIFCSAVVIFFIDLKHQIIPDSMLVIAGISIVLLGTTLTPFERGVHMLTALSCGLGFFLLWVVTRGRGLGFGDVKLAFVIGLLLGYPSAVVGLYVAFLTGALVGVILMILRFARMKSRIAFGPFLLLGAIISIWFGERILNWWNMIMYL